MMSFRTILAATVLGHLSFGVHSWVLDETCRSDKIDQDRPLLDAATNNQQSLDTVQGLADPKSIIQFMVEEAFAAAKDTATAVVESLDENPPSQTVKDLLKDLFAGHSDAPRSIRERFAKDASGTKGVLSILDAVVKDRSEYNQLPAHEVVVFCDQTRFVPNNGEPERLLWDTVVKTNYVKTMVCSGNKPSAWANRREGKYDVIQMCPHYLEKIKQVKYRTLRNTKPDTWTKKMFSTPLKSLRIKTGTEETIPEIDFTSKGEQTVIHELMHTQAGGGAADVGDRCYQWENCKNMAANNPQDAMRNAESNSYFALGIKLSKEGIRVDTNGDLVRAKNSRKTKRQHEVTSYTGSAASDRKRWVGSSAARAALALPVL